MDPDEICKHTARMHTEYSQAMITLHQLQRKSVM